MALNPFHLAIPVADLASARRFYEEVLGCSTGRNHTHWVDLNLYGHQLVLHEVASATNDAGSNPVDGEDVPVPHFGVVLDWDDWHLLAERLQAAGLAFIIEPGIRFEGEVGEQATMFFLDPSGNAIEFKAMAQPDRLFAK